MIPGTKTTLSIGAEISGFPQVDAYSSSIRFDFQLATPPGSDFVPPASMSVEIRSYFTHLSLKYYVTVPLASFTMYLLPLPSAATPHSFASSRLPLHEGHPIHDLP